jgi:hypothetical protein
MPPPLAAHHQKEVPTMTTRPDKATVLALLEKNHQQVSLHTPATPVQEATACHFFHGSTVHGRLAVNPRILGWTWDELNDPDITN